MMIRWYRENPEFERRTMRSIKVGLPVQDQSVTQELEKKNKKEVDVGHVVPEADRYEHPKSIKLSEKIYATPHDVDGEQIETPLAAQGGVSDTSSHITDSNFAFSMKSRHHFASPAIFDLGCSKNQLLGQDSSATVKFMSRPVSREIQIDFESGHSRMK